MPINLFFLNQISAQYKQDEKQLTQIIHRNVRAADNNGKIKLNIYYENKELSNLLIKNNIHKSKTNIENRHYLLYQYFCKRDGCEAAPYIGYTTFTLKNKFKMHTQNSSSTKKHLAASHNIAKVTTAVLLSDVKVIGYSIDKRNLIFLEAILIKNKTPTINSQKEGCDSLLKNFQH